VFKKIDISIIIPVYNGERFIKKCFNSLSKQRNIKNYEIIIANDASTDNTINILKKKKLKNLKIFSLKSNKGPAAARNLGLKKAKGKYVYFLDIDDEIAPNSIEKIYKIAKEKNCDYVFSDFKKFEKEKNQRKNVYNYPKDRMFSIDDIKIAMKRELYDASLGHLGLFGCNGRLIKRSLLKKNKIFFDEKLRWMEDKTFGWKVLSYGKKAFYVRKQLYYYYFHPNFKTNVTVSLTKLSPLYYVGLILKNIKFSLINSKFNKKEIMAFMQQGVVFFTIQALVSLSNQIFLKKINKQIGIKYRRKLINKIFENKNIAKSINKYKPSNTESKLIPRAIKLRSIRLLESACNLRSKQIAEERRKNNEN
jgi:glycosyltransferase involved in cell wall biosynthesis